MTSYKPFLELSDLPKIKLASGEEVKLKGSKFKNPKRVSSFTPGRI